MRLTQLYRIIPNSLAIDFFSDENKRNKGLEL